MPELIEIACPHCDSSLKLKSRAPLGKKVECPKCSQPFVAKERRAAAAPVDDYEDYEPAPAPRPKKRPQPRDEFDDFDDLGSPDDFGAPPRRSSGGRKKKPVKKSKSAGGWVKWVLIGGGGVGGLAVLILGIWLAFRMFGSKSLDLAWLPDDANNVSVVRVGDLWKSALVQEAIDSRAKDAASKMKDDWGFGPQDIVSVTRGTSTKGMSTVSVLRTSVDLNEDTILKHAGEYEKTTISGRTAYRLQGGMLLFFPDQRTAVSGTENGVTKAIDQGPKPAKRDDLKFVDGGAHIINVHLYDESTPRLGGSFMGMDLGKVRGNFSWSTVTSSVKGVHGTKYANAEDAADAMDKAERARKEMEKKIKESMKHIKIDEEKMKEIGREVEKHISSSQSGPKRSGDTIRYTSSAKPLTDKGKKFLGASGAMAVAAIVQNPSQLFNMPMRFDRGFNPFGNRNPNLNMNFNRNRIRNRIGNRNRAGFGQPARGRVTVYEVTVGKYQGELDKAFAIKACLIGTRGLDDKRTEVTGNNVKVYSQPNQIVNPNDIINKLRAKGFQEVGINRTHTE